jgi:DNA-binding response OmpR family regulator
MHILVVEDDEALAALVRRALLGVGYTAEVTHWGDEGLQRAQQGSYDALILDLMLPGLDGMQVARRLREQGARVPILMLTARDALADRLRGFAVGADDYLCKPFAVEELIARLRAITRRSTEAGGADRLVLRDLVLDRRAHEVTRAGRPVALTPREYALLEYLMSHPGQALSRTGILERVWGYDYEVLTTVVEAAVSRLRRAIGDDAEPPMIQAVRGVGYRMRA